MEALFAPLASRIPKVDFPALVPACSWTACRRRRNRLQSFLRRDAGIRCGRHWFCSPGCLEQYMIPSLHGLISEQRPTITANEHRVPLGLILISRGLIDGACLQKALRLQKSEGGRIGDCLRRICGVSDGHIASALAAQWACPVYPPARGSECRYLLPQRLQEFHRMLPVHLVEATRDLYIAFEQRVDYTVLLAVEEMLGCHTKPCVLPEPELRRRLAEEPITIGNTEVEFASSKNARELASSIASYLEQTGAENIHFLGCGPHIWLRMQSTNQLLDLLVRRWR